MSTERDLNKVAGGGSGLNDELGTRYEIVLSTNPDELRAAATLAYRVGRSILADEFARIAYIVEENSESYQGIPLFTDEA